MKVRIDDLSEVWNIFSLTGAAPFQPLRGELPIICLIRCVLLLYHAWDI